MSEEQASRGPQRALVFIDGANFYRRLKEVGVSDPNRLDLRLVASKLAGPARRVVEIRYYTGKVEPDGARRVLASHQRLLASLHRQGVVACLGRIEQRTEANPLADDLLRFLASPPPGIEWIEPKVHKALHAMASGHRKVKYWIQKAVDTFLAVDIARLAIDDAYDVAYLLSQDGDLTPGIDLARRYGKQVFGVGPAGRHFHIKRACDDYIVIDAGWLGGCYLA